MKKVLQMQDLFNTIILINTSNHINDFLGGQQRGIYKQPGLPDDNQGETNNNQNYKFGTREFEEKTDCPRETREI